jgi:transcriptional regulator with XRE-family HTH domain
MEATISMKNKPDPIQQIKMAIGAFFRQRRESLGWKPQQLRDKTGVSGEQITGLEDGTGNPTETTLLRVMIELGIGMHFTQQNSDEAVAVTVEGASTPPAFLTCTDGKDLYVLHWQRPAFLVLVVQTVPHHLRFVATYGHTPEQVRELPVWDELEKFVKKTLAKGIPLS